VTPPDRAAYEAELAEYLAGADVPDKGDVIAVRIHRQRPEVVVRARD
jgi:hypothetical protein